MPLGIIVVAVGAVGLIAALASYAQASGGGKGAGPSLPQLPPSALPPSTVPVPKDVAVALESISKGTASPEILANGAQAALDAGLTGTANQLSSSLDTLVNKTVPAIVAAPNKAASPIPNDPTSGKPLWKIENRGGVVSAIPMFHSVLAQFTALQAACGASQDGRIGPKTLAAFKSKASQYPTAPTDIGTLAANCVKWTEIIKNRPATASVGGAHPFREAPAGFPAGAAWRSFASVNEKEMQALLPKVRQKLGGWVGMKLPGTGDIISLSGLMGVVSKAGIRGANRWLENPGDRVRYPHTTKVFQQTNGLF